jgi:hypothetical protein
MFRLKQSPEAASLTWQMREYIDVGGILAVTIPIITLVGGVSVMLIALHGRQRLKELAYQERIALIEKGLVPSPETDPAGFESVLAPRAISLKALRFRSAGLVTTGLGMALMILLFFVLPRAGRGIAIGIGGSITLVGLTVLGNGLLLAADDVEGSRRATRNGG